MRIVLDTNVLLSGLATHGLCESLVQICFNNHKVILSKHILNEVAEHYKNKFKASNKQTQAALKMLRTNAQIVAPTQIAQEVFHDADDLPVIGTAIAGQADAIVTGDKQLASLCEYEGVKILLPRQLYEMLK